MTHSWKEREVSIYKKPGVRATFTQPASVGNKGGEGLHSVEAPADLQVQAGRPVRCLESVSFEALGDPQPLRTISSYSKHWSQERPGISEV